MAVAVQSGARPARGVAAFDLPPEHTAVCSLLRPVVHRIGDDRDSGRVVLVLPGFSGLV